MRRSVWVVEIWLWDHWRPHLVDRNWSRTDARTAARGWRNTWPHDRLRVVRYVPAQEDREP